jgi:hypothetical protein
MARKRRPGYTPPVLSFPALPPQVRIKPPPVRDAEARGDDDDAAKPKRKYDKGLDDTEFGALVRQAISNAINYDETQIQPDRLRNRRFYLGDTDEDIPPIEDGSRVVSRDVRDTLHAMLPSLFRIFFSGDNICEFVPQGPEDEKFAEKATQYVNYLIQREGIMLFHDVFFDALLSKVGVVKLWWDEKLRVEEESCFGLTNDEFSLLLEPEDEATTIKLLNWKERPYTPDPLALLDPEVPMLPPGTSLIDCRIRRTTKSPFLRFEAIPPEERLIDPMAKRQQRARYWGHRTTKTVDELIAMGYDRDEVEENMTTDDDPEHSQERAQRQPGGADPTEDDLPSKGMISVEYCELFIRCDRDGDGAIELWKVCTMGSGRTVVHDEIVTHIQGAEFTAVPQPHIATGRAIADDLIDVQTVQTGLNRGVLESLAHSIYPRYGVVENGVEMNDVLSTAPGQPIRMQAQGNVEPITVDFVGQAALAVSEKWDSIRERRTGVSDQSQGLDPDALQSTPAVAAAAMVTAAQMQTEMVARMLAETGMKTLFKLILKEVVTHQRTPQQIRFNGEWGNVDPREWNADMDVIVRTGLGRGNDTSKSMALTQILSAQKEAIAQGGPDNPLCNLDQMRRTLAKLTVIGGFHNPDEFFNPQPMQTYQQQQQKAAQTPPPPPVEVQVAQIKAKVDDDDNKAKQLLDQSKFEEDVFFKCIEYAGKYGVAVPDAQAVIDAIRGPAPLPSEALQHPYPIAQATPALSNVVPPHGLIVPLPHIANAAAAVAAQRSGM